MTLPLDLDLPVTARPAAPTPPAAQARQAVTGTPPAFEMTVRGEPAPQGSKRGFVNKHTGRVAMVESSKKVGPWRDDVKAAAENARDAALSALDGPLYAEIIFTLPKPKSAPKTRQIWPDRKPDLDKLARAVFDALRAAGVYTDDARVVELRTAKRYPLEGQDALVTPGAVVRLWPLDL